MSKRILLLLAFVMLFSLFSYPLYAADQTINLKAGFNFVSFTVTPPADPAEFKSQNSAIEDIFAFNASAGSFMGLNEGSLTSLSTAKGYIIKAKSDSAITVSGSAVSTAGDIPLKPGFNLIGFSKASASKAFSHLMNSNSIITGIYKWNLSAGTFISVVRNNSVIEQLDGVDPTFKAGETYFIKASENTSINYDNDITTPKILVSLSVSPASDKVSIGGSYDLNKIKAIAYYSDNSTAEIKASYSVTSGLGTISGALYAAPKRASTDIITAAYSENNITKEAYFTLIITDSSSGSMETTTFKCSYKLSPEAIIIDEETVKTQSMAETNVVIEDAGSKYTFAAGKVLMGYTGNGYLREVTSAQKLEGNVWLVQTKTSTLEKAFEELDYQYSGKLSSIAQSNSTLPGSPENKAVVKFLRSRAVLAAPSPDRGIISPDKLKKILDNLSLCITLTKADINFDPILNCDIKISWFKLKRFLFAVGGIVSGDVAFSVEAKGSIALPINAEFNIYHSMPFLFTVGPVPFTFEWDMNCGVDAKANAIGEYSYSNKFKYSVKMGAEYTDTNSWKKIYEITKESQSEDSFGMKGTLEIKPYFNIGFMLKMVGLAGPKITLEVFFSMLAELIGTDSVDFSVSAGITAKAAFIVQLFSYNLAEFSADIYSLQWELYKKSINLKFSPPAFSPPGGTYLSKQTITLSTTNENAIIKYTIDGTTPSSSNGTIYAGPFEISSTSIVNAITISTGAIAGSSAVSSATYTITTSDNLLKVLITAKPSTAADINIISSPAAKDDNYYYFNKGSVIQFTKLKKDGWYDIGTDTTIYCKEEHTIGSSGNYIMSGKYECELTKDLIYATHYTRTGDDGQPLMHFDVAGSIYPIGAGSVSTVSSSGQTVSDDMWAVGTKLKLTATPKADYLFDYWDHAIVSYGRDYMNPRTELFEIVSARQTNYMNAHFAKKRKITIVTEPSASDCLSYNINRYLYGNYQSSTMPLIESPYFGENWELKLVIVPAAGKRFKKFEADYGSGRALLSVYPTTSTSELQIYSASDVTVYATAEPMPSGSEYAISTSVEPAEAGSVSITSDILPYGENKYAENSNIKITAETAAGYKFLRFEYGYTTETGTRYDSTVSNPLSYKLTPEYMRNSRIWTFKAIFQKL